MRVPSRWSISVPRRTSIHRANLFRTKNGLSWDALRLPNQRLHSTQNGIQCSTDHRQRPAKNPFTPRVSWQQRRGLSVSARKSTCPRGDSWQNTADRIQEQLDEDGHHVWGFVVYRCTYSDDAAWEIFLERINASIRDSMEYYNGLDLLDKDCFRLTVIEDASKFDGASRQIVREHFKEWRKLAVREEQGTPEYIEARRKKPELPYYHPVTAGKKEDSLLRSLKEVEGVNMPPDYAELPEMQRPGSGHGYGQLTVAARYRLCVQVDEAALQSVMSTEEELFGGDAWVNLIEVDWEPGTAAAQRARERIQCAEWGLDPEVYEWPVEVFPEIDGSTEENVGWMKVPYQRLIPECYADMMDYNGFGEYYTRPPDMHLM